MSVEKSFIKYGFVNDICNYKLKEILKNDAKFKMVNIDIYPENPLGKSTLFMLLLRSSNNNVKVFNDGDRIILFKDDIDKTCFMNVLITRINECFFIDYDKYIEFVFNIQNTYYRLTVFK